MSKYIEMVLALGEEFDKVELKDVKQWSKDNRHKYIALYEQMQLEKNALAAGSPATPIHLIA